MNLENKILLPEMDPELVSKEIENFIVEKVRECGYTGGVVGLSGGVDSTTTAALAKRGFDRYGLELVGYILSSSANGPKDTKDGIKVAEKLGIRYEVQNIEPIIKAYSTTNPETLENGFHKGNLMSRIRANILSTKAATEKKIVIGTGNKDEDFGIGYYTLFGDGAVHISPIGNLPKRLVRQMATYLGFEEVANREPTAGLEKGQTDFKDLGYNYDAVEIVIEGLRQGVKQEELVDHSQVKEIIEPQLEFSKFYNVKDVVNDIARRHYNIALTKAKIIHPPIAEVTLKYE